MPAHRPPSTGKRTGRISNHDLHFSIRSSDTLKGCGGPCGQLLKRFLRAMASFSQIHVDPGHLAVKPIRLRDRHEINFGVVPRQRVADPIICWRGQGSELECPCLPLEEDAVEVVSKPRPQMWPRA